MHILHTLAGSHLGGMEFRVLEQAQWLKEQDMSWPSPRRPAARR